MPTDYQAIARENITKYGTDIETYGPLLLANLYSDRTHFIYELLQNAEDALKWRFTAHPGSKVSRSVTFELSKDRLEVAHFGLPFREVDVRGICGLAQGTKREDLTAIGKFGIGFKSVYAYTKHPEVHSEEERFVIESFVRPREVSQRRTQPGETLFVFPFDQSEISPSQTLLEIGQRLRKLGFRTLLFLNYIEAIEWAIQGSDSGHYLREEKQIDGEVRNVTLVGQIGDHLSSEEWLVFKRPVSFEGEPVGNVEIAFEVVDEETQGDKVIKPITDSTLVSFFGTEKETHLGFLVQGPYRTTPSRDNIPREDDWNKYLTESTADLLHSSLNRLREMGMLTVSALESLPLKGSYFGEDQMFRPLFETVRAALATEDLIPRFGGGFVSANRAKIGRGTGLRELLQSSDLQVLYNSSTGFDWITEEISEVRTPDLREYLVRELGVEEVTPQSLVPRFSKEFIEKQSDEWVIKFYRFLVEQPALWRSGALRQKPFIRLQSDEHVPPFDDRGRAKAFLPGSSPTDFPTVKENICKDDQALEFLKRLGLAEPDIVDDVIQNVLAKYPIADLGTLEHDAYTRDLRKILAAFNTDSRRRREELLDRIRETPFLRCKNGTADKGDFRTPSVAYLPTETLCRLFDGFSSIWFVDTDFVPLADEKMSQTLEAFGVSKALRRVSLSVTLSSEEKRKLRELYGDRSFTREIELLDYTIEGLNEFLKRLPSLPFSEAEKYSSAFWNLLCESIGGVRESQRDDFFQGRYTWHYYNQRTQKFEAQFLKKMQQASWLPSSEGRLKAPFQLYFSELPPNFEPNPFLKKHLKFKPETIHVLAKEVGIDPAVIEFLRDHKITFERLKQLVTTTDVGTRAASSTDERDQVIAGQKPKQTPEEAAITQILGPDAQPPTRMPPEFVERDPSRIKGGGQMGTKAATSQEEKHVSSGGQEKIRTFVYVRDEDIDNDEQLIDGDSERRAAVDRAGISRVLDFEQRAGRLPTEMPPKYPGYDIESKDKKGNVERCIEVKSVSDNWGSLGVALSSTQFETAKELKHQYWLYVVENAEQKDGQIFLIPDPAWQVNQFVYNQEWKKVAATGMPAEETSRAEDHLEGEVEK